MTLDELLDIAKQITTVEDDAPLVRYGTQLAQGLIDLLGEAQPCGFEPPFLSPVDGELVLAERVSIVEARAYAATIIRAAEEAERLAIQ